MPNNSMEQTFLGRVPINAATALLFFKKEGISQKLIHHLKYKGKQEVGVFFGKWMGQQLNASLRFDNLDGIVMVPLHKKRMKERGYNQLTLFAKQLSKELNIPVLDKTLVKISHSSSQTKKNRLSRFEKIDERFYLTDTKKMRGKHILLIDDVLTTGATLEACANEILRTPNVKISIATMVVSDHS
jgi:ComF family protein